MGSEDLSATSDIKKKRSSKDRNVLLLGLGFVLVIGVWLIYTRPLKENYIALTPEIPGGYNTENYVFESSVTIFGKSIEMGVPIREIVSFDISSDESTLVAYTASPDRTTRRLVVDLKTNDVKVSPVVYEGYTIFPQWIENNKYVTQKYGTSNDALDTLIVEDLVMGEVSEIFLSNFKSKIYYRGFNRISPDEKWITNGQLDFFNIKEKQPLSISGPEEDIATLWFSDSKRIIGCHNWQVSIWNIETQKSQLLNIKMPDNTWENYKLMNCTDELVWLVEDKVVVGNFYYDLGDDDWGECPCPQDWLIVDLEKLSATIVPNTKFMVTDPESGLAVAVWNRYNANGSSGIPHVTLYDRSGAVLKKKVFDVMPNIESNRHNVSIVDKSHIFYSKLTEYYDPYSSVRSVVELVLLNLDEGTEKVLATSLNYGSGHLLSDKNTWIATSGNKLIKGKIDENK